MTKTNLFMRMFLPLLIAAALFAGFLFISFMQVNDITIDASPSDDLTPYLPFQEDTGNAFVDPLVLSGDHPRLDGDAATFPLYSAIVNAAYPETTALGDELLHCSGPEEGISRLAKGECDIYFGFAPNTALSAAAEAEGAALNKYPVGYQYLRFFVHPDNPVQELTLEQLRGICSGEITNWSELGGADEDILFYQYEPNSPSQLALEAFMVGKAVKDPITHWAFDLDQWFHQTVTQYQNRTNAIGFTIMRSNDSNYAALSDQVRFLSLDGEEEATQYGSIMVSIYAITKQSPTNENVQTVIDWILSPQGQHIVQESGYTPIGPTE